jgi:RNA ligase (TIGR02306 family)
MEIKRKLASIREISALVPIEGADKIELAQIDGWQVVVKKGEFRHGDRCIYFEIDSFLPVRPEFEFLRASSFKNHPELGQGFRLKTVKLRGQISQGLALPTSILANFGSYDDDIDAYYNENDSCSIHLGSDCTEYIGVKKWEDPIPAQLAGMVKGTFPNFIPKTDQERVQNMQLTPAEPKEVTYIDGDGNTVTRMVNKRKPVIRDFTYEVTLKLDGSSMTVYNNNGEIGVCSRNMDLIEDETNAYWRVARKSGLIDAIKKFPNYAVQGELMGPGVQGNREGLLDLQFFLFDIYDIWEREYLNPTQRKAFFTLLQTDSTIEHVPVVATNFSFEEVANDRETVLNYLLNMADCPSLNNPIAEGLVFKAMDSNFSFKVINNNFLLNEK